MGARDYRCAMRHVQAGGASQCEARAVSCWWNARSSVPDGLERAEAELAVVVEARGVDPFHVRLAMPLDEGVVRVRRLPAVDDEVPARRLDVAQQLGADVAAALREE